MDDWRTILYPLGFLSALFFGARFIIQWYQSEKKGKSVVTPIFWYLSLVGNFLLGVHTFLQAQYPICLIQVCNGVISWRNLDLMKNKHHLSLKMVFVLLILSILFVTGAFWIQSQFFLTKENAWFRIPSIPWDDSSPNSVSWLWHLLGTVGYVLFSSRFWVQWWDAEMNLHSALPLSFWWLSLFGALFSSAYFLRIHDLVNLIGPLIGLIPYSRNLMLIYKDKKI